MATTSIFGQLKDILNGPVVAGVGATVDAGLTTEKYHALPWDPNVRTEVSLVSTDTGLTVVGAPSTAVYTDTLANLIRIAIWNTENVLNITELFAKAASVSDEIKANLKTDIVAILFVMLAYGYHGQESRILSADEVANCATIAVSPEMQEGIINVTRLNRAATFILARMHTKYQTNHAIGGTPMQASMASAVRAFYGISPSSAKAASAVETVRLISDCMYWALHPANETLLIPSVIANTRITTTHIATHGPPVSLIPVEEYFQIRARTPPASTHHFYVCAAAIKQLDPIGILVYLPEPSRTSDVLSGLQLIELHGAALHPAARFWGFDRVTSNQKLVESLCADLGYAVRKLSPASSLAASPILMKEDALDSAWKGLIDAIRAAMDERGKELLDKKVFDELKAKIAPTKAVLEGIDAIKGYLTTGRATDDYDEDSDSDDDEPTEDKGKAPESTQ